MKYISMRALFRISVRSYQCLEFTANIISLFASLPALGPVLVVQPLARMQNPEAKVR